MAGLPVAAARVSPFGSNRKLTTHFVKQERRDLVLVASNESIREHGRCSATKDVERAVLVCVLSVASVCPRAAQTELTTGAVVPST